MKSAWFASALVLAILLPTGAAAAEAPMDAAATSVLMEADTGRVLWEKNGDEPRLIASTTKIMTALIALETLDPDLTVTVDPKWTGVEGSSMYLRPGQEITVRDLLYGLMLASGNDAAAALACAAAGSIEAFAAQMNRKAAALGCRNTHFENPSGLDGENHRASARDLALITREALENEMFREIVSTPSRTVGEHTFSNHNRLLRECEGVFGVKTGYTKAAGRTLVTCCERGGVTLICVTLSDPDDWNDHRAFYDWGFGEFVREEVVPRNSAWFVPVVGGVREEVPVILSDPLFVFRRADEAVRVEVRLPSFVYAGIRAGATAGEAVIYIDGEPVSSEELVFAGNVDRADSRKDSISGWDRFIRSTHL